MINVVSYMFYVINKPENPFQNYDVAKNHKEVLFGYQTEVTIEKLL